MAFARVDFPQPASPTRGKVSWLAISKEIPSTAWTLRSTWPKKPPCRSKRTASSSAESSGSFALAGAAVFTLPLMRGTAASSSRV